MPGRRVAEAGLVAAAQPLHLAGAHEHDVARLDGHARLLLGGRVEVVAGDGVVVVEVVDALEAGDVEQDAAGDDRPEVLDAELRRAGVV